MTRSPAGTAVAYPEAQRRYDGRQGSLQTPLGCPEDHHRALFLLLPLFGRRILVDPCPGCRLARDSSCRRLGERGLAPALRSTVPGGPADYVTSRRAHTQAVPGLS